jgi:predicted transcriptional regulator
MFDIARLKALRRSAGLTQRKLAQLAGVSQSLVAKIEAGRVDPSYSNVLKLEQALTAASQRQELLAQDIMTKRFVSIAPAVHGTDIANLLAKNAISQLPVLDHGRVIGLVTESDLLRAGPAMARKSARDIMADPPPIVPAETRLSVLTALLLQHPLILIAKKDALVGVVTKADVVRGLAR